MFKRKKISQFKKDLHSIVLDDAKKTAVRENILAFMQTHPVRISENARLKNQNRGNLFTFLTQKHMYATLALILTLLAGSGTAMAAENTLPGDTLYGVKVHVNEPVRGALAVSEKAKDEWATKIAERRLDEATKLSAEGKLTAEKEDALKARIVEQTDKIQKHIEELKAAGDVETASNISTHLESVLSIHQEILNALDQQNDTEEDAQEKNEGATIRPLLKELREEKEQIHDLQKQINEDVKENKKENSNEAATNRMNASQKHIDEVEKFFADKNVSATSTAMAKLTAAKTLQEEGKTELTAGNFAKAFQLFGQAQRTAQEAKITVALRGELKHDEKMKKILDKVEERKDNAIDEIKELREDHKDTIKAINEKFDQKIDEAKEIRKDILEKTKDQREALRQEEEKLREKMKDAAEKLKKQQEENKR